MYQAFLRAWGDERVYCIFNFCNEETSVKWGTFNQNDMKHTLLFDHWGQKLYAGENGREKLIMYPYQFLVLEPYTP